MVSTFQKGSRFEQYVLKKLFPNGDFVLVHRTNNYEENKSRFSENSLLPDFKFRCKNTGLEFYVECKYRSKFNLHQQIDIISNSQRTRLKEIERNENIPIFFCIGYEGRPNNPDKISLIPFEELKHDSLYQSFLLKYAIPKNRVQVEQLMLNSPPKNSFGPSKIEDKTPTSKTLTSNKKTILIASLIALLFVLFILFKPSNKDKLEDRIKEYYSALQKGDIDRIDEFVVPKTERWFSKKDVSVSQIKAMAYEYRKRYPLTAYNIDFSSFKVEEVDEGFNVEYILKFSQENPQENFEKDYTLKIYSTWDSDLMITSMKEERIY